MYDGTYLISDKVKKINTYYCKSAHIHRQDNSIKRIGRGKNKSGQAAYQEIKVLELKGRGSEEKKYMYLQAAYQKIEVASGNRLHKTLWLTG